MFDYVIVNSWWDTVTPVSMGHEPCSPGHRYGPAIRSYYLLHYVFEGEGDFYRDGVSYHLNPGDIFVIRPEEVTTYQASLTNPWHYCWLGFRAEGSHSFLNNPVIRQPPVRRYFEQIANLESSDAMGKAFILTYQILLKLYNISSDTTNWTNRYAEYAKAYLDANYMRNVSIQRVADSLHIDRRYLTEKFREAYGQPPQAYLMELRLEKAREFLMANHSVTEAATMVGFGDIAGFSRQYKRHFGLSPSQQRRQG